MGREGYPLPYVEDNLGKAHQVKSLLHATMLGSIPVSVEPHATLSTIKSVVQCHGLWDKSEDTITKEMADQRVVGTHCTMLRQEGELQPSDTLVLTFNRPMVPKGWTSSLAICASQYVSLSPALCCA